MSSFPPLKLSGCAVDLSLGTVTNGSGAPVVLRPQALAVLKLLLAKPGAVVSKDEALAAVWPGIAVTDDSLVQCITEIRKAVDDRDHAIIKTVPKRGYVFVQGAKPPATGERLPVIAVLPFDELSTDRGTSALGEVIAEDLIAMLGRSPDVTVIARPSSFAYKDKAIHVRDIGRQTGAEFIVEGSVRKQGEKLRVVARLSDALAGIHLWSQRFDATGADLWSALDRIARTIVSRLIGDRGEFEKAQYREAWSKDTACLTEFDYYLRGEDLHTKIYQRIATRAEYDRAGHVWRQGLTVYPNSPLLKIGLGLFHFERPSNYTSDNFETDFRQAGELAQEVLAEHTLSPYVRKKAELLMALACGFAGDFPAALRHAREALELAPHECGPPGHLAANVFLPAGKLDVAAEIFSRAMPSDALSESCYDVRWGLIYLLKGENETALKHLEKAWFHHKTCSLTAVALVRLGRLDEARSQMTNLLTHDPAFTQTKWRDCNFYSNPAIIAAQCADLAKAGLPET